MWYNSDMFSERIQRRARQLVARILRPMAQFGISPNLLTCIGLLLSAVTALVIAQGVLRVGGLLVLFAGVFDMFDGAMARVRNVATTFGAFLDSTLDRYSESIILFGYLFYALQHPGLQDPLWPAPHEQFWMIAFIYMAVVGSLMVSYTKARAEGLGIECKTGLLARPERVILLAIGLLTNTGIWALALLAVLSNITAVQRIYVVWRNTQKQQQLSSERNQAQTYQQDQRTSNSNRHLPTTTTTTSTSERATGATDSDVQPVPTGVPPLEGGAQ
ncbi:CDP-alcohol phosphatidyltransferase family protein [Ktedonobacteria bacterium brp13]|nr:CDP-alcohol phosphatidyltransferase family protein [Ktedonobacteria bacterium brp13]